MASGAPAERKLVTVLFADLAGSTELVRGRDPEHVRALLSAFFEEMAHRIEAFGGAVEKYAGDAIMAVFGVPVVHEDDAERAVRAATAMQESLAQLNPMFEQEYGTRLELRVGIATGEAVAATESTSELMVTGEVANLAGRLQSASTGIVVSQMTHRLLQPLLDSTPLPPLALKGFSEPVTAHRVTGLRQVDTKPRGIPGISSPVVGRDGEMETLRRCVDDLRRGRGQIVSIVGEAGIGKSRVKIELREGPLDGVRWLEGRCHAYTESTSYAPFIQVLRAVLQLGGGEPSAIARTKLRAGLRSIVGAEHERASQVVGHLLGITVEPGQLQAPPDPRALQSQLVLAARSLMEGLLARSPVILAFEDIHWADAASIDLLTALTELTDLHPLMILVTSRPDAEGKGWELRFHAQRNYAHRLTEISLGPLALSDTQRLAENLLRISDLPGRLRERILERSEGNPFYLEEIIRSLIEAGVLRREGDRWTASVDPDLLSIPETLRGVIAARIDRLPRAAKTTLQHASIVGRYFSHRSLQALGEDAADLDRALAQLLRAELIREWARLPEREYLFKHALTQEAAYGSLLGEHRRMLHGKFASHLEAVGGGAAEHAAVLAYHWLGAENWPKALEYTLKAADRARKLYARPEAIAHFWQALELLERLPSISERARTYVETVLSLVQLPGWTRNAAGQREGLRHVSAAIPVATDLGDEASLARLESVKGFITADEDLLRQGVARAEVIAEALTRATTAAWYGQYLGQHGRYETALVYFARVIEMLGAEGARYEQALNMNYGGRCYCSRAGRLDEALRYAAGFREIAEALDDPRLRALRAMEAEPYMYLGLWSDVVRVADESLAVAWEIREASPIYFVSAWAAIAYLKLGRPEDAARLLHRALREGPAAGPFFLAYPHIALAQLRFSSGELGAALDAATRAIELADNSGFRLEQGAARRVLGQVHDARASSEEADGAFRQSLDILESIQASPELAQTLLAYGRFKARNDPATGEEIIRRALRIFEATGATGWLEEARAALQALA